MKTYKTCESVRIGHPDKLCDFIADFILDSCLEVDPDSRVACEVMATGGKIIVAGEITCELRPYIESDVNKALQICGYSPDDFRVFVNCHRQSKDIASGVSNSLEERNGCEDRYSSLGAGDQGTVYGYATNETEEMLPLPLVLAHNICREIDIQKREHRLRGVMPDGKAQVTVEYENGKAKRIKTVVVSVQHSWKKPIKELEDEILNDVLPVALSVFPADENTEILINPSGCFNIGGPEADTAASIDELYLFLTNRIYPQRFQARAKKRFLDSSGVSEYRGLFIARNQGDDKPPLLHPDASVPFQPRQCQSP